MFLALFFSDRSLFVVKCAVIISEITFFTYIFFIYSSLDILVNTQTRSWESGKFCQGSHDCFGEGYISPRIV